MDALYVKGQDSKNEYYFVKLEKCSYIHSIWVQRPLLEQIALKKLKNYRTKVELYVDTNEDVRD